MSELMDYKMVCGHCHHENAFRVECETITPLSGSTVTYRTETVNDKICEKCGCELKRV